MTPYILKFTPGVLNFNMSSNNCILEACIKCNISIVVASGVVNRQYRLCSHFLLLAPNKTAQHNCLFNSYLKLQMDFLWPCNLKCLLTWNCEHDHNLDHYCTQYAPNKSYKDCLVMLYVMWQCYFIYPCNTGNTKWLYNISWFFFFFFLPDRY